MIYIAFLLFAFILSFFGTKQVLALLKRLKTLDVPNERSNHKTPTPRGGGIAVVFTVAALLVVYRIFNPENASLITGLIISSTLLALVSFLDDIRPLPAFGRFAAHIIVVVTSIYGFHMLDDGPVFQGFLPGWLDTFVAAFLWLWFMNLYNFMDGIDGITTVETSSIAIGIFLVAMFSTLSSTHAVIAVILLGTVLGFGIHNWHPAKIFMGDVGSIPLGYLVGYLLLSAAAQGFWAVALVLPAYYLFDSTYTILRRLIRKQNIFEAHSEHFYQKAVRSGKSHSHVALSIAFANIKLIVIAVTITLYHTLIPGLAYCAILIALLVVYFSRVKKA
ncbi:MAG: glycosyltransferase family 4 protein [Proteobacteria bacterium]|nr:glycosyltransferase family 4 protein [Pseudomonadota bacterium]